MITQTQDFQIITKKFGLTFSEVLGVITKSTVR